MRIAKNVRNGGIVYKKGLKWCALPDGVPVGKKVVGIFREPEVITMLTKDGLQDIFIPRGVQVRGKHG